MYGPLYQVTHDMDIFFVMNGYPTHLASNGGILPNKLGTIAELQDMQIAAQSLQMQFDYGLNFAYLNTLNPADFPTEEEMMETGYLNTEHFMQFNNREDIPFHVKLYAHSFVEMAKRGFWSFDRLTDYYIERNTNTRIESAFQLVAWPIGKRQVQNPKVGHEFEIKNYTPYYLGDCKWDMYSFLNDSMRCDCE